MILPEIVYFQTATLCNGHCRYCPFDDIYAKGVFPVSFLSGEGYKKVIDWLVAHEYAGRLGFLLHYEPTLDQRLPDWIKWTRGMLPKSSIEIATNGIMETNLLDIVDVVDCVPPGQQKHCTSRAGNARACEETIQRNRFSDPPCILPVQTMCVASTGELLLCCQDWRHEAVVGTVDDLSAARERQLSYFGKMPEICQDCMAGLTAEEVGDRLGRRKI